MSGELTDADHEVTFHNQDRRTIRAAYATSEDKQLPGMLVFKDRHHQVVAILSKDAVLAVERVESEHVAAKEITEGGFQPTSHVMAHMNPGALTGGAAGVPVPQTWTMNVSTGGPAEGLTQQDPEVRSGLDKGADAIRSARGGDAPAQVRGFA